MNPTPQTSFGPSCEVDVISACGPVRTENQDAGAAWRGDRGEVVLVVADGMGGHAAGREAAEIVVKACLESLRLRGEAGWEAALRTAIGAAHAAVLAKAGGVPDAHSSMGSTVAVAALSMASEHPRLYAAHVGDSRIYLYRGRSLYRLTTDHSFVATLVRDGLLREEEAWGHPDSNVILRAIGQAGPLEVEIQEPTELAPGDLVLLSSDGLHGALPDPEIAKVLGHGGTAAEICAALLAAALAAASQDNVTIACARLAGSIPRRSTRTDKGGKK